MNTTFYHIAVAVLVAVLYAGWLILERMRKNNPHTHRCFSGTQIWCTHECTIAADPDVREVFHKCITGGLVRLGVDTAVFYPIADITFDDTKTINEVVGDRLFAALGITTPEGKQ